MNNEETTSSFKFDEKGFKHIVFSLYTGLIKDQVKFWFGVVVGIVIALLLI